MDRRRRELTREQVRELSAAIFQRLVTLEAVKQATVVGAYLALPWEVQTDSFVEYCWDQGKKVAVPAWLPLERIYRWREYQQDAELRRGPWGVPEPVEGEWLRPKDLEVIIVPGVAFDHMGRRLGHGLGYFDRLLPETTATRIGLAFDFQLIRRVPVEKHDQKVDLIVTEKRVAGNSLWRRVLEDLELMEELEKRREEECW